MSIGRKYFSVKTTGRYEFEYRFHIDNWIQKTDYSIDYKLYETKEQWDEDNEASVLFSNIKKEYFSAYSSRKLSLYQLRKIAEIVELA